MAELKKKGKLWEYTESLLVAVLVAFFLRSFVIEPFKVPSGSMFPTILIGDHLFVNKFIYGLRIPFTKWWPVRFSSPERGEVVVFFYPMDETKDFIKRVVGVPGDHIIIEGRKITINGEEMSQAPIAPDKLDTGSLPDWEDFDFYTEKLGSHPHLVQYYRYAWRERYEMVVPKGFLFVMGDNRDRSSDSREWGFVPMNNLKGRAMFVWLSLDYENIWVRWKRFGSWIR